MAHITIHPFTANELDAVDKIAMAAYGTQSRKETLQHYLILQPNGAFVAKQDGKIVGFGAALEYDMFAYIGLMSVQPAAQKQGIGRILLEHILSWLDRSGSTTVLLDASPAGAPLYERYGFVDEDITVVLQQNTVEQKPTNPIPHGFIARGFVPHGLSRGAPTTFNSDADENSTNHSRSKALPTLIAFDAPHFGSERATVLTLYWKNDPQRLLVTDNTRGQITGYLIAQSNILGPWIANNTQDAERLLVQALALPFKKRPSIFVSSHNEDALHLFERYNFTPQRTLRHMRRGKEVSRGRHTSIYGQASLGFG